jgi:hypothetical protein
MSNEFWSWRKILPESWTELIFGIIMIGMLIIMLMITIDVFLREYR